MFHHRQRKAAWVPARTTTFEDQDIGIEQRFDGLEVTRFELSAEAFHRFDSRLHFCRQLLR